MKYLRARLVRVLMDYFGKAEARINHALRVLCQSDRIITDHPGCDEEIALAAALLHDVGIKVSEEKLGYNNEKTQEEYGPAESGGFDCE
jgi:HD superfamily phosphodiesterase